MTDEEVMTSTVMISTQHALTDEEVSTQHALAADLAACAVPAADAALAARLQAELDRRREPAEPRGSVRRCRRRSL